MKRLLKWTGILLGSFAGLAVIFLVATYFISEAKLNETYQIAVAPIEVPSDSATIARGHHLLQILSCQECHGDDLSGKVFVDAPPFRVVATNLTSGEGGVGGHYDDVSWDLALRHGINYKGQSLLMMPSKLFHNLSDVDAAAVIAYLKQVPPVDNVLPETEIRVPGRAIVAMASGLFQADAIDHARPSPTSPEPGPTAAYGAYLASVSCIECHGENLRGGVYPGDTSIPAPDLAAAAAWPLDLFATTMRTGITPDGRQLDKKVMPWPYYQYLTDDEVAAIHAHLQAVTSGPVTAEHR